MDETPIMLLCGLFCAVRPCRCLGIGPSITVVNNPHYHGAFGMSDAARWAGVSKPRVDPFYVDDHPGDRHGKTEDDGESFISAKDDCRTYVFSKPADGK